MMMHKKEPQAAEVQTLSAAELAALSKKKVTVSLIRSAMLLVVLVTAVSAWMMSNAWFARNQNVAAEDSGISSASVTGSLFISDGTGTVDNTYKTSLSDYNTHAHTGLQLFPISTADMKQWYYVSGWQNGSANEYTEATPIAADGSYANTAEGNAQRTAYMLSRYKLYTNDGSMDVYLDPTNGITVSGDDALKNAIRVGLVIGDSSPTTVIYAPANETGGFKAVRVANTGEDPTEGALNDVRTDLSTYTAAGPDATTGQYTANGSTALGQATTSGLPVKVYVWLEGTDNDATITSSNKSGLSVTLNYVGIPVETQGSGD